MKNLLLLLITITTLFSCSKEELLPSNQLIGKYIVLEGPYSAIKSIEINESVIYYLGEVDVYGTRTKTKSNYEIIDESTIRMGSETANIIWDEDRLTIQSASFTYKLIKENSLPAADKWIEEVGFEKLLDASSITNSRINDLTYSNGYVYTDGHRNLADKYVITQINLNNLSITDKLINSADLSTFGYGDNIEYMGSGQFWVYDPGNPKDHMFAYNSSTLAKVNTMQMPYQYGGFYHLGANDDELWGVFYDHIREWDFVTQKWGSQREFGLQLLDGLDLDEDHLYISGNGVIHKYSLSPFKAVAAYELPDNYSLEGFTLTNTSDIIASAYNYSTTEYEIIRINLP